MALETHIVSHTHWDREWYHPVERFRQRLVALIDELLDDPPGGDESFLLDGQAIVVEDYLDVRPERAPILVPLLRAGRLEAGPWYVLADELIPGGEAIVRNLLTGRRMLGRLNTQPPPVLYCPDSFGHPAALPSIAKGFGLPLVILWRGYGGPRWPAGDTVRWTAPSGDDVVVFHLPRDGYELGSNLPLEHESAASRWAKARAELLPRSTTGVMLLPHGADHHARQTRHTEAIRLLAEEGSTEGVRASSLRAFAERLVERAAGMSLPTIRGELRDSYGYTWALQGTFATRAHEKRMNAIAERRLVREAEVWSALAARDGNSRWRALVDEAWRTLLRAHPHDTLCGCSIDEVADAMELRVTSATNQALGIRDDAILALIGHDPVAARTAQESWQPIAVVTNPAPRARSGVAMIEVEEFIAHVGVGPGSASTAPPAVVPNARPRIPSLGPVQVLSRAIRHSRTESPRHYPDDDLVTATRVAAWIDDAPAYGITSHAIGAGRSKRTGPEIPVRVDRMSMQNEFLSVGVGDGRIVLESLKHDWRATSLIELVDERDVGDLYTPAPRARPFEIHQRSPRRGQRGPLRGELAIGYRLIESGARIPIADVELRFVLDAASPLLQVIVSGDNRSENHRLRLAFHTGITRPEVWADAAFGPVRRERIIAAEAEQAIELPPPTAPLHRYVSAFGRSIGATVFSDGLGEYEARDDGAIIVTLVRAVGELSRNDLPERPGHAGWPSPTPGAQCLGPFAARLAIMPHGARDAGCIDAIERVSDDFLCPLRGFTLRSALRLSAPVEGIELVGQGLSFSTAKQSDDGEWLVLRCVNLRDEAVDGEWRLPFEPTMARLARLDETVIGDATLSGHAVGFTASPREILTILVR